MASVCSLFIVNEWDFLGKHTTSESTKRFEAKFEQVKQSRIALANVNAAPSSCAIAGGSSLCKFLATFLQNSRQVEGVEWQWQSNLANGSRSVGP